MTCWMWSMSVSSVSFLPASSVTWNTEFCNKEKEPQGMDQNRIIDVRLQIMRVSYQVMGLGVT